MSRDTEPVSSLKGLDPEEVLRALLAIKPEGKPEGDASDGADVQNPKVTVAHE